MATTKEAKTKKKKGQIQGSKPEVSQQISESLNILKSITENLSDDEDSPDPTESPKDPTTGFIQISSQVELSPLSTNKGSSMPPKGELPPAPKNTISSGSSIPSTCISGDIISRLSILERVEQLLARSAQAQSPSSSTSLLPSNDEIERAKKLLSEIIDNKPDVILFSSSEILTAIQVLQQNPAFSLAQQSLISEFQSKFVSVSNAYHSANQIIADFAQFLEKKGKTAKELQEESNVYKELLSIKGDIIGEMDKLNVRAALLEKELADVKSSLQILQTKHEELNAKDQLLGSQIEEKTKTFEEQLNILSKKEEERNQAAAEGLRIESNLPSILALLKNFLT